jgi:hypothetical protein
MGDSSERKVIDPAQRKDWLFVRISSSALLKILERSGIGAPIAVLKVDWNDAHRRIARCY